MNIDGWRWKPAAAAWLLAAVARAADDLPAVAVTMDTTVITPTRSERTIGETAPAVTVITGEELEREKVLTVLDALREVPGLGVIENGSRGANASIFIRGSSSDEVLVLIDGVRVNSTTLGSFDFSDLTPENIERIEILRGWGGTLYGSEAVGGVIQIFTRKGEGPPRGSVTVSGGNGSTDREVAEISGGSGIFGYSASVSHLNTEGFKPRNDEYENTVVTARVDAAVVEDGAARVIVRASESEFGNFFSNNFLGGPDPNAEQERGTITARGEWAQRLSPVFDFNVSGSYARDDLDFVDPPDEFETSSLDSTFLSETVTTDGHATVLWWDESAESVFGVEYEEQSGDVESLSSDPMFGEFASAFDESVENLAGYTLHQIVLFEKALTLIGGVRVDDNDRFGTEASPAGGGSYALPTGTRLRATYAQGFKAPSLNELFFPGFGNPNLDAETSWEVTAGLDQSFLEDAALVTASVFRREVDDLIEGVPDETGLFLAQNVGEATIDGVEASVEAEVMPGIRCGGEYTFLDIEADVSGRIRRPRHSGSIRLAIDRPDVFQTGDSFTIDTRLLLVGARPDFDPLAFGTAIENPAYQRADLTLVYGFPIDATLLRHLEVFTRFENLFDRDYEEALGFGARPLNVIAGLRGEFS